MDYLQDSFDDSSQDFTIDYLPLDCIVCICEYLAVNDLARFAQACRLFYEASLIGYLWRRHCLSRWTFCDVQQISHGPHRWKRYFVARRRVEASMERGRPGRDYKVKTLRGHEGAITAAHVIGGDQVNWENLHPPLVVSLSQDGFIKAWDILQAKPMWDMKDQGITAVAVNSATMELATGCADGSITLWSCEKWSKKMSFKSKLGGQVLVLRYGTVKSSKLPPSFIMAHVSGGEDGNDQLEIRELPSPPKDEESDDVDPSVLPLPTPTHPLFELWAPAHNCNTMQLSTSGLLAVPGRAGDVHVWDLTLLPSTTTPPPLSPHVTVNTQYPAGKITWMAHGILATLGATVLTKVEFWDIQSKIDSVRKSTIRDNFSIFSPLREISCDSHVTVMTVVNNMVVVGDGFGQVCVYNGSPKVGGCLQRFRDHKGAITDIYADSFRVLTCSKDFSIRVYCWKREGNKQTLESKYTLLGGSVAHKTHDGFNQLLCEASSCVGIAGNQLKFYTFISPPLVEEKLLTLT